MRSATSPSRRQLILWLSLVTLGLLTQVRSASASGCHALEKPVLGSHLALSPAEDLLDELDSIDRIGLAHFRHPPCPDEIPDLSAKSRVADVPALPSAFIRFDESVEIRAELHADPCLPLPRHDRPERPPRAPFFVRSR